VDAEQYKDHQLPRSADTGLDLGGQRCAVTLDHPNQEPTSHAGVCGGLFGREHHVEIDPGNGE